MEIIFQLCFTETVIAERRMREKLDKEHNYSQDHIALDLPVMIYSTK